MIFKGLRKDRNLSQEQLAELSGLSLRTIQRIESSDYAAPESLAALAAAFKVDVAALEQELAMDKSSNEWKRRPAWVRSLFFGSGKIHMDRRQFRLIEFIAVIAGVIFVIVGVLGSRETLVPERVAVPMLLFASLLFLSAYLMSVIARVGDHYSVWRWTESNSDQARSMN